MQSSSRSTLLATVLITAVLVLALAATGFAQKNLVYVNTNTGLCPTCAANHNSVIVLSNDGTGRLSPVKGSPFKTGGTGMYDANVGAGSVDIDEDNELIISPDGNFLFTVNMHSNNISAFTINTDGSLTAVVGSPFASNGPQPASLGLLWHSLPNNGSILAVANKDSDPAQPPTAPNFSSFTVSSTGVLTLNTADTITLPTGSSPSNVLINAKGSLMFGLQFIGTNNQAVLGSYRIKSDGSMNLVNSLTPPSPGKLFLGIAQHPTNSALYVGLPDVPAVGVYQFGVSTGLVSFKRTVSDPGQLPCWLTVNAAGTRLYVADTGSNTVSVYDLTAVLTPVLLQSFTLASGGTFGPTNLALDPTGAFLYVLTGNELHVLTVSSVDGTLTETVTPRPLNLRAGTVAAGLATLAK